MPELSRSRRKRQRLRRRVYIGGALILTVLAAFYVVDKVSSLMVRAAAAKAVTNGDVRITAVKTDWDIENDRLNLTVFLSNSGEDLVMGRLVFEVTLQNRGLSRSYLEELFRRRSMEQKVQTLRELQETANATPRQLAMLRFLENGGKTTFPEYEPMPEGDARQPPPLDFRRESYGVALAPGELARAVILQDLPSFYMGNHITTEDVKLIGVTFE